MKITLIRPNMIKERQSDALEPLAFSILKGLTPKGIDIQLFDDRIEEVDFDEKTDLVALSVETFAAKRAYEISSIYRKKGIPVVMGGFHPSFMPDEILEHADSVVIGDAEGVWEKVLADVKKGNLAKKYKKNLTSLEGINFSRDLFSDKKYNKMIPIQYSRGCKFNCDFCSINAFYENRLLQRPINEVMSEIEEIGAKYYFITDDNIFINKKKAKEFFRSLIPLKIKWVCQVSVDVTNDDELMELMSRSGCMAAIVGFESLDNQNLKLMNKNINIKNDYSLIVKKFQQYGIMIFGTFVFGYDFDTPEVFDKTLEFAIDSKMFIAQFNPLMPMPGTTLYQRLKEENRLIYDKWWIDPNYKWGHSMYKPKTMTPEELQEGSYRIRTKFNEYNSILRRALTKKNNSKNFENLFWYLIANFATKKEIHRKMGRVLGS